MSQDAAPNAQPGTTAPSAWILVPSAIAITLLVAAIGAGITATVIGGLIGAVAVIVLGPICGAIILILGFSRRGRMRAKIHAALSAGAAIELGPAGGFGLLRQHVFFVAHITLLLVGIASYVLLAAPTPADAEPYLTLGGALTGAWLALPGAAFALGLFLIALGFARSLPLSVLWSEEAAKIVRAPRSGLLRADAIITGTVGGIGIIAAVGYLAALLGAFAG